MVVVKVLLNNKEEDFFFLNSPTLMKKVSLKFAWLFEIIGYRSLMMIILCGIYNPFFSSIHLVFFDFLLFISPKNEKEGWILFVCLAIFCSLLRVYVKIVLSMYLILKERACGHSMWLCYIRSFEHFENFVSFFPTMGIQGKKMKRRVL